jgi:hypothetical protein
MEKQIKGWIDVNPVPFNGFSIFNWGTLYLETNNYYFSAGQRGTRVKLNPICDWSKIETYKEGKMFNEDLFPALALKFKNQPNCTVVVLKESQVDKLPSPYKENAIESVKFLRDELKYKISEESKHTKKDIEWLDVFFNSLTPGY